MSRLNQFKEELTALNHKDLSDEIGKINKVKGDNNHIPYNVREEIDIDDAKHLMEQFDDYLDETNEKVEIIGYNYSASRVLKKVDLVRYIQELNTFLDNIVNEAEEKAGVPMMDENKEELYDYVIQIDRSLSE